LPDDNKSQRSHKSHVSIEFSDEADILMAASGVEEEIITLREPNSANTVSVN